MCLSLTKFLSVADNEGDALLLHVSASNEVQEWRNEKDAMTQTTELHKVAHNDVCGPSILFIYTIEHPVVQVTFYITHTR